MSVDPTTFVGPFAQSDGTGQPKFRQGKDGRLIVNVDNGEEASRGKVFSLHTIVTGVTIAAGHVSPPAAAAATTLTLSNPVGSGVNLEILRGTLAHLTGTPGTGVWSWCGAIATGTTVITATVNATPVSQKMDGAVSVAVGYAATALTAGPLHILKRHFNSSVFAGAIGATSQNLTAIDEVNGQLILPPGSIITLAPPLVGTTHVVAASILFREVAFPS